MAIVKEVRGSIIGQIPGSGKIIQAHVDDENEFDLDEKVKKASQLLDDFKELTTDSTQKEII